MPVSRRTGPATGRDPWVERVIARHRRRKSRFDRDLSAARRPADQVGVAVDYLRGALGDAPPEATAREVDALISHVIDAVARLHHAELRSLP